MNNEKKIKKVNKFLLIYSIITSVFLVAGIILFISWVDSQLYPYDKSNTVVVNDVKYRIFTNDEGEKEYLVDGFLNPTSAENRSVYDVVLEDEIKGKKVTKIGLGAFQNSQLNSIILSKNIVVIESQAFYNCLLNKIEFNENLTIIEKYSFKYTTFQCDVVLPNSLEEIGYGAFMDSTTINGKLYVNETVKFIRDKAFSNFKGQFQENIHFKSLKSIGNEVFSNNAFEKITFSNSLEEIGKYAFSRCYNLKSITFNSKVSIPYYAFVSCYNLKELYLTSAYSTYDYIYLDCPNINVYII